MNDHIHYQDQCEHGTVVAQCRCIGEKRIRTVACPKYCPKNQSQSLDKTIFAGFMAQPDGRSGELQVIALVILSVFLGACSVAFEARYPWDPRPSAVGIDGQKPLPTPPPAATPTPTPTPKPLALECVLMLPDGTSKAVACEEIR